MSQAMNRLLSLSDWHLRLTQADADELRSEVRAMETRLDKLREVLRNIAWNSNHITVRNWKDKEGPDGWSGCGQPHCGPCVAHAALEQP